MTNANRPPASCLLLAWTISASSVSADCGVKIDAPEEATLSLMEYLSEDNAKYLAAPIQPYTYPDQDYVYADVFFGPFKSSSTVCYLMQYQYSSDSSYRWKVDATIGRWELILASEGNLQCDASIPTDSYVLANGISDHTALLILRNSESLISEAKSLPLSANPYADRFDFDNLKISSIEVRQREQNTPLGYMIGLTVDPDRECSSVLLLHVVQDDNEMLRVREVGLLQP